MLLTDHVVNRAEILVLRSDAQFDIVTCWDRGKTHFTPPVELLAPKVTRDINILSLGLTQFQIPNVNMLYPLFPKKLSFKLFW